MSIEMILSVIAAAISVVTFLFSLYTFSWTAKRDKKQATLDAYNRLQNEVFDKLNLYSPAQINEICKNVKLPEYKTLGGHLARIEHFCVGINTEIYDRKTFYSLAHGYFDGDQIRARIEPIIENKNRSNTTGKRFYDDITKVFEWMEKQHNIKNQK